MVQEAPLVFAAVAGPRRQKAARREIQEYRGEWKDERCVYAVGPSAHFRHRSAKLLPAFYTLGVSTAAASSSTVMGCRVRVQ
mmetsp:Transcript_58369/g.160237  ORF Transcript_58369/g.160237 Transcript_58369/m.160237 type:complete len:82 (+) Transcript_58369:1141-1386(+)